MFRKFATTAMLGMTIATAVVSVPAEARHHYRDGYNRGYYGHHGYGRGYRGGRCYDKGNGGLAIGAIGGGLAGNMIAGHGDKLLGTAIGAVGGGLIGRSIDRSDGRRC